MSRKLLARAARARRGAIAIGTAVLLAVAMPSAAHASVSATPDDTAAVAGSVYALGEAGDRTLVGGLFTKMGGKPRSNVAAVRPDGSVDPAFVADTNGKVEAVATSTDGSRVFIGGTFTTVNGVPRANLAAVDATTGAVIEGWSADTGGLVPTVHSLAVHGDRLYVAGKYSGIGTTGRSKLAAVATDTAAVITSFTPKANGSVREVVVSPDGSTVFAGGGFSSLGGVSRPNRTGAVHADTGAATPFAPAQGGGSVVTVALSPDGSRFFFSTENNNLFAYDHAISDTPVWVTKTSGNTQAIAVSQGELYMGGHFSGFQAYGIKRPFLASVNPANGVPTTWDPKTLGGKMGVWALMIEGSHVHAGGVFSTFDLQSQRGYARFTGTP